MKSVIIILGVLAVVVLSFRYPKVDFKKDSPDGIQFHTGTWNEALKMAKKENKLIFLDVYATWCGPCKKLKSKTFSDKEVGAYYNSNFINVSADGENGEGITLSQKYGIQQYPSLLFIDASGEVKASTSGFHNTKEFIELGKSVNKK